MTTGTGSGKNPTYLLPIVDAVFRNEVERWGVQALIVYPMNALIKSQVEALEGWRTTGRAVPCASWLWVKCMSIEFARGGGGHGDLHGAGYGVSLLMSGVWVWRILHQSDCPSLGGSRAAVLVISQDTLHWREVGREIKVAHEQIHPIMPLPGGLTHTELIAVPPEWNLMIDGTPREILAEEG